MAKTAPPGPAAPPQWKSWIRPWLFVLIYMHYFLAKRNPKCSDAFRLTNQSQRMTKIIAAFRATKFKKIYPRIIHISLPLSKETVNMLNHAGSPLGMLTVRRKWMHFSGVHMFVQCIWMYVSTDAYKYQQKMQKDTVYMRRKPASILWAWLDSMILILCSYRVFDL